MSSHRLHSTNFFARTDDEHNVKPARVLFLAVEGNITEVDYFRFLNQFREELGFPFLLEVQVLQRANSDTNATPSYVIDLLEECIDLRENGVDSVELSKLVPEEYDNDFLRSYINDKSSLPARKVNRFEDKLYSNYEIDIAYLTFLANIASDDDIFGIVIDLDKHTHDKAALHELRSYCESREYNFFISCPCFEFWLLLHLCDVKEDYKDCLNEIKDNRKVSGSHTYISREVSNKAGHNKHISQIKFKEKYLPNVSLALNRAKDFETNSEKIIEGEIGTNVGQLFSL